MASTSLSSPLRPFSSTSSRKRVQKQQKRAPSQVFASKREAHDQNYYNGRRIVDENLIVLRKRIHEMKMIERNYDPPADWMDWEKNIYTSYDEIICEAMGLLQSQLMNARPCLALGVLALISFSVPMSTAVIFSHLLEMTKDVLGVIHLN